MPANLPPDYFEEEKKLRQAKTIDEKIEIIERMIAIMPHHKGTDKLLAAHRAKIAKLKEERERRPQSQKKGDTLWNVKKEGAGQVLFIGFPNSGKSTLVSNLTGEELEIADYPFTTRHLLMRMMRFEDIMIQLVDTTAIGDENTHMWFGNMIKKADVIVSVIALTESLDTEFELIMEEVKRYRPDLNQENSNVIIAVNKIDFAEYAKNLEKFENTAGKHYKVVPVSAKNDVNLYYLKEVLFKALGIIRLYSKLPGKKPDMEVPFILEKGSTVLNAAERIHKDFVSKLRYAKLWREGSLNGMMVSKDFVLEDKDIIELHL
jgi:small GTP-binding protein